MVEPAKLSKADGDQEPASHQDNELFVSVASSEQQKLRDAAVSSKGEG